MTRPPCVRLYPAYPGNPRLRIEGESPQSEKDIRSSLIRATNRYRAAPGIALGDSGIAPGDEFRHDEALAAFAKPQISPLGVGDLAACRGNDGVAGGDIPFAGRREAGIDIGFTLGHAAEF